MAGCTLFKFTILQVKPTSWSSHLHCPCSSPLPSPLLCYGSTSELSLKPYRKFQHAPFGSLVAKTCARFVKKSVLQQRLGGEGSASSQIAAASLRNRGTESQSDLPPSSKEEAVQQAGACLLTLLEKSLKQQGPTTVKQRKAQRQIRLRVDIPLLDNSPRDLVTLAVDLLDSFLGGEKSARSVAVYLPECALPEAALQSPPTGKGPTAKYLSLERREGLPGDALAALVIAPGFSDATALDSVARNAGARPIVVVNPEWTEEEEQGKTWGAFLSSFCVAYSFVPLNIQGFFSKTEGAVLKHVRSGAPEGRPWLIYVKEGDNYKCVSSLKKRPTPADLENALYSSIAANSPVNKSIMFLRGLVSK